MASFPEKNTDLYTVNETMTDKDTSSLTTFGTNSKDNLVIFGKRIKDIIDGSSDDSWDDKVKTQINTSIEKICEVIEKEEKAADFIKDATPIVDNMVTAEGEYVLAYDAYEEHKNREAQIEPKEVKRKYRKKKKKDDASEENVGDDDASDDGYDYYYKTEYTDEYKEWLAEEDTFKEVVPALEEQGITWRTQVNSYFLAFNYEKNEIDTSIYKPITTPLVYFGDLYEEGYEKYTKTEYKPNVEPEPIVEQPIEEVEDTGITAKRRDEGVAACGDLLINGVVTDDNEDAVRRRLLARGFTPTEAAQIIDYLRSKSPTPAPEPQTEPTTEHRPEPDTEPTTEHQPEPTTETSTEVAANPNALGPHLGQRYAGDWEFMTTRLSRDWQNGGLGNAGNLVSDITVMVADGALDTVLTVVDTADYGLNWVLDGKAQTAQEYFEPGVFTNLWESWQDDWDHTGSVWEGVVNVGESAVDLVQWGVNGAVYIVDWGIDGIDDGLHWVDDNILNPLRSLL